MTSLLRQNDVATSFWHNNDVIIASCVCWARVLFMIVVWWNQRVADLPTCLHNTTHTTSSRISMVIADGLVLRSLHTVLSQGNVAWALRMSHFTGHWTVCSKAYHSWQQRNYQSPVLQQRNYQSPALPTLCEGNPPVIGDSPHKGAVIRKVCSCDDAMMSAAYLDDQTCPPCFWGYRNKWNMKSTNVMLWYILVPYIVQL